MTNSVNTEIKIEKSIPVKVELVNKRTTLLSEGKSGISIVPVILFQSTDFKRGKTRIINNRNSKERVQHILNWGRQSF